MKSVIFLKVKQWDNSQPDFLECSWSLTMQLHSSDLKGLLLLLGPTQLAEWLRPESFKNKSRPDPASPLREKWTTSRQARAGKECQGQQEVFHNTGSSTALPTPDASWRCAVMNPEHMLEMEASRTVLSHNQEVSNIDCISATLSPSWILLALLAAQVSTHSLFSLACPCPVFCSWVPSLIQFGLVNFL